MNRSLQLLFALTLAFSAFAQTTSETIDVSLINLDVYVTDKQGNRVYGLTPADFEVRENGKLQPITNFTEYQPQSRGSEGAWTDVQSSQVATEAAPHAKRTIVIFVEVWPQPTERVREVFASLREFVQNAVRPGDAATIIAFRSRAWTAQRFTDNRDDLAYVLGDLEQQSVGLAVDYRGALDRARESDVRMEGAVEASRLAAGQTASAEALERKAGEYFALLQIGRKSAAMSSIMEGLSGVEGKKIMVMALHDFGVRPVANAYDIGAQAIYLDTRAARFRDAVMRTANANNFTLYPMHIPGFQWQSFESAAVSRADIFATSSDGDLARAGWDNVRLLNQTASLQEIAQETGGVMAAGPSDITKALPHVLEDLDSYYSLAYRATPSGEDRRHKVTVTAKNRDYQVRSRRAIVEKSDDTQMNDRVVANLFQTSEYSVIPLRADIGEIRPSGRRRWQVPVRVHFPRTALTSRTQDGATKSGAFSVFVVTGGDLGVISEVVRREQEYSFVSDAAAAKDFTYTATIEIDQFPDTISIGVRDDVSKEFGLTRASLPSRAGTRVEPPVEKGGAFD